MTKIIAFGYKKGVGKNVAGKFLDTALRLDFPEFKIRHVSFAAKLKDIAYQLYGWAGLKPGTYYETHYQEKEIVLPKLGLSPRDIWIGIGNKIREVYKDTWINYALYGIEADILIVTDLRFRNEANAILKVGGILIKIKRDGLPQGDDPAETELDVWVNARWNYIINNNGTFQELYTEIEKIAKNLGATHWFYGP